MDSRAVFPKTSVKVPSPGIECEMTVAALPKLSPRALVRVAGLSLALSLSSAMAVHAQPSAFAQSVAVATSEDEVLAAWYRSTGHEPLWTGADDADRRHALLSAIAAAADHGLPVSRYDARALTAAFLAAETEGDRGRVEVAMSRAYLAWARDLTSGVLEPSTIDPGILRESDRADPTALLRRIAHGDPETVLAGFMPRTDAYLALMRAKIGLESVIAAGGWGAPLEIVPLASGDSGPGVVALRDRLMAMGFLAPTATASFDRALQSAVQAFQIAHGLVADGRADEGTLREINLAPEERLKSIIVAMERERWLDIDRSTRHIWVNLPDFRAKIMEGGRTLFDTRVVIGKNTPDQRSPEFSDEMEHMVINPSWGVPRSIIVKEYLPLLQSNPNAVSHLQVVDGRGRVVPRGSVDFAAYSARSFPYGMRQPPSDGNALGKVKFMFPNPHNIYLHDTPSKSLFDHDIRAYSHGCIRVADPFDLAYALLALQSDAPEAEFKTHLDTGRETTVPLERHVPVHLVYFTAYPDAKGRIGFRRDVYGRDAALWQALESLGVALPGVQG
jgi:L,D-transpeptidase YcbB